MGEENNNQVMLRVPSGSHMIYDSLANGQGIRTVLFVQGCTNNCIGCHNPQTQKLDGGCCVPVLDIVNDVREQSFNRNITLSGGEPFLQTEQLVYLLTHLQPKSVWAYTGFTYEQILASNTRRVLLEHVDVLVDGPFVIELKKNAKRWTGSSNQRIIDVKRSIEQNKVVLWEEK